MAQEPLDAFCPRCRQQYSVDPATIGHRAGCENCGTEFVVGEPSEAGQDMTEMPDVDVPAGGVTISEYMDGQGMRGGVQLGEATILDPQVAAGRGAGLQCEKEQKYRVGGMIAHGGMGAVLDAKDLNIRRQVAMKVMLNPDQAPRDRFLRFIEEAQVTGQLEHPSIVPVHELGVDAHNNLFYTMKLVHGVTIKDVLKHIADGDAATIEANPLSRLLNVFLKACDAMAFAHANAVIHRDLKPENVMIGEFGEVLVMDW